MVYVSGNRSANTHVNLTKKCVNDIIIIWKLSTNLTLSKVKTSTSSVHRWIGSVAYESAGLDHTARPVFWLFIKIAFSQLCFRPVEFLRLPWGKYTMISSKIQTSFPIIFVLELLFFHLVSIDIHGVRSRESFWIQTRPARNPCRGGANKYVTM